MNALKLLRPLWVFAFLAIQFIPNTEAQMKRDGSIRYYQHQNKSYALYFPSSYRPQKVLSIVMAFHPLHTHRWNAQSWRDHLISFAERHQVILICPDGGQDGKTDDDIDLQFSRHLLQYVIDSYSLRIENVYTMGYSWGARAALKMALQHSEIINGCLLWGVNASHISIPINQLKQSSGIACFFVHGQYDYVQSNLLPLTYALDNYGACTKHQIVPGVGHSLMFPRRSNYLDQGFRWLTQQNCYRLVKMRAVEYETRFRPEFRVEGKRATIFYNHHIYPIQQIRIYNKAGILVRIVRTPASGIVLHFPKRDMYTLVFYFGTETSSTTIAIE